MGMKGFRSWNASLLIAGRCVFLYMTCHKFFCNKAFSPTFMLATNKKYSLNWWIIVFWIGSWYGESSRADSRTHRAHRSSSGHSRLSRAVLGGGLTIDTLPDNTTHLVVSAPPQALRNCNGLWHYCLCWICFGWRWTLHDLHSEIHSSSLTCRKK